MLNSLIVAKSLYDSMQVLEKVVKDVKKENSPIQVRNLGSHGVSNEIEIFNSTDTDLYEVRVEIVPLKTCDCYWYEPNNSDNHVLYVEFLPAFESLIVESIYTSSQDSSVDLFLTWKNRRRKIRTQSISVHMRGWNS